MFDWLFEGRIAVYCLLGVAAVMLLLVWWRTRKRNVLLAAGAVASLAGVYFLLDRVVETDREQIERKVTEMAAAVSRRDTEAVFRHISAEFVSPQGHGKEEAKGIAAPVINSGSAGEVIVWDFNFDKGVSREKAAVPFTFSVKAKGASVGSDMPYRCDATFHLDPDGQWRLKGLKLLDPITNQEIPLPF